MGWPNAASFLGASGKENGQIDLGRMELQWLPGSQPPRIHQVVDQGGGTAGRGGDGREAWSAVGRAETSAPLQTALQQLCLAQDRGERVPQVVSGGVDEGPPVILRSFLLRQVEDERDPELRHT